MADDVFSYQDAAAKVMASARRFGLFDGMGVGKTATTIRAADRAGAVTGIVICPASIRENWRRELMRFQTIPRRLLKINSIYDFRAWMTGHYDVGIISFERAADFIGEFRGAGRLLDFCAIDEGHYLKNPESGRAKRILGPEMNGREGYPMWCSHAWWITGTPAPNDPSDLWTWLRFLEGPIPEDLIAFKRKYFSCSPTQFGSRCSLRDGEPGERLRKIIAENSISRSMAEVGIDLPPIKLDTLSIEVDAKAIDELLKSHPGLDARLIKVLEEGGDWTILDKENVTALRRVIGDAKSLPYAKHIAYELNNGLDKIVIFGHHREAMERIGDYLQKKHFGCVYVRGGMAEAERVHAVDSFNRDPKTRVFLGNHRAAGVGLNLQEACCNIDLFESDWTPSANAQSLRRIARFGQTRNMWGRFVQSDHWLDARIQQINREKTTRILDLGLAEFI